MLTRRWRESMAPGEKFVRLPFVVDLWRLGFLLEELKAASSRRTPKGIVT